MSNPMSDHPTVENEELRTKVAELLKGDFACTRVWEAWQVGTMTEDDFEPLEETERVDEIVALIASEVKKKEVETHDWYWHHQIYIGAHGIGPVSLENKEKAQAELASLKDTHTGEE